MNEHVIEHGYRVIGRPVLGTRQESWYMSTLEEANKFAESLSAETGDAVAVCKLIGIWKVKLPTEFIQADDWNNDARP